MYLLDFKKSPFHIKRLTLIYTHTHIGKKIIQMVSLKRSLVCFAVALFVCLSSVASAAEKKKVTKLQIGIKKRATNCERKTKAGDRLSMHYVGTLHADGSEFDSSRTRNDPFVFTLGTGQVIKGWDQGLLGMCEGEMRKLVIPSDMGYGSRGAPPKIPADATLVFEVELLAINAKDEV